MKVYIQNYEWDKEYEFEEEIKKEFIYTGENILLLKKKKYYSQTKVSEEYKTFDYDKYTMLIDMNIYKDILTTYIPYEHLVVDQIYLKKILDYNLTFVCCKYMDQSSYYFESNEKIFIDRSESPNDHCQIKNNNEVIEFLNKKGFTSYKVGQLSFKQQIHLFKNAKIIVGAHGAAFANLAFCNPGTQIIEIKPIHHPNYVSKTIGTINDLKVKILETPKFKNYNINLDINELNKNL
jgi:hypothetical protein